MKLCATLLLFFVIFIRNLFKNLLNDNVIDHFRKILNNRHRQTTLDRFLKKESQDCSSAKRQKKERTPGREKTPEGMLPDVFMEGNFPSKQ